MQKHPSRQQHINNNNKNTPPTVYPRYEICRAGTQLHTPLEGEAPLNWCSFSIGLVTVALWLHVPPRLLQQRCQGQSRAPTPRHTATRTERQGARWEKFQDRELHNGSLRILNTAKPNTSQTERDQGSILLVHLYSSWMLLCTEPG